MKKSDKIISIINHYTTKRLERDYNNQLVISEYIIDYDDMQALEQEIKEVFK
jgi:hypothetical protein